MRGLLAFLLIFSVTLMAESWSVVYLSRGVKLQKSDIVNIYFKKMKQKEGQSIVALNLDSSNLARKAFLKQVLHSDLQTWDKYYDELYFMGIKSPVVVKSEESMLKFLLKIDRAIGYLPTSKVDKSFTELTRFKF